jgi:hypothetical protein
MKSSTAYCAHCKNLGLDYTSHYLRKSAEPQSPVVCPVLLNTLCMQCGKKGHTRSYCSGIKEEEEDKKSITYKSVLLTMSSDVSSFKKPLVCGFYDWAEEMERCC